MATERDEQQPYEGGGGAGGKFRKRPFRRSVHTTPYDRPPPTPAAIAFRNLNGGGGGWLSKLVDPAQRLIASGAHRLFSSVFRKRLPPPEPPLSSPVTNLEARNKEQEALSTDFLGAHKESVDQGDGPSYSARGGELTDLEQVLKQKTFTRSEIDRLTALLNSRTVDLKIEDKGKRPEVVPLKQMAYTDRQEGFPRTPAPGNRMENQEFPRTPAPESRIENQLVSTPVVNSTVLEGGVASPTELVELAKSYMHKKPVSPSMLGFRNQGMMDNPTAMYTHNLSSPSRLPFTPIVPRITSGHVEARENGFITPRSRGRSAIYSMARTPYSRVHPTNTFKGVENAADIYGGASSSSQNAQGAQKRRSSVLESDIGSYGAIRRIRQKPNLLSSRGLSMPVSSSPLPPSVAAQNPSSSRLKPLSVGESLRNPIKPYAEDGDNCKPNANVPSKSSEMASKILQQLDKLVSPKDKSSEPKVLALMDKSPGKLSPSMLRGQALKSLEHVDSSKFFGEVQHNKMADGSANKIAANVHGSTSQEKEKVKENGPLKLGSAPYKFASKVNGSAMPKENGESSMLQKKDAVHEASVPASFNSVAHPPPKKRAFQMSAFEDFVDLDEDIIPNGTVSDSSPEGRRKSSSSLTESKNSATEFVDLEKASASTDIKPVASEIIQKTDIVTSTGSANAEKNTNLVFQNASSPSATVFPSVIPTESIVSPPVFNVGVKIVSEKDSNAASPTINLGFKSAEKLPESQVTFVAPANFGFFPSSDTRPETSSKLSTVADGTTDSLPKLPEPGKAENKGIETEPLSASSTLRPNTFFNSTPTSNNVSLMNGPSISTSSTPVIFNPFPGQNSSGSGTFTFASTTSGLTSSIPTSSVPPTPLFKFESSVSTTTETPPSKTTPPPVAAPVFTFTPPGSNGATPDPVKIKKDVSFGNLSTPPTTIASTTSSPFGFTATATSTTSANQSLSGTGVVTFAQNVPVQFSSNSSAFGLAGSAPSAAANSTFGSNLDSKPFSSATTPVLGGLSSSSSASSEANLGSSGSISAPSAIGSTWQQPKSPPVFSFTANSSPSTGFSFSATTASNSSPSTGFSFVPSSVAANSSPSTTVFTAGATTSSAAVNGGVSAFGLNGAAASSSSPFTFNSASTAQPGFGNPPNPGFAFVGNNDQMSMEDSMAEDTVQSSSAPGGSMFGQPQPIAQAPPAFNFAPTGPTPAIGNPFQFGSQQNLANPQNPSPFQATGSLGSNFSMGSGGSGADKSNRKFIKVKHKQRKK